MVGGLNVVDLSLPPSGSCLSSLVGQPPPPPPRVSNASQSSLTSFLARLLARKPRRTKKKPLQTPPSLCIQEDVIEQQPQQHVEPGEVVDLEIGVDTEDAPSATDWDALPPLAWGAEWLSQQLSLHVTCPAPPSISRHTAMRRAEASAFATYRFQAEALESLCELTRRMSESGVWKPVMFLEHQLLDETPLRVRIEYGDGLCDTQTGKVHVIETSFCLLVEIESQALMPSSPEKLTRYIVFEVTASPQVRASQNATAETMFEIAKSVIQPPDPVHAIFPDLIRLIECDEGPANNRMEMLVQRSRESQWQHLRSLCMGHKVHLAASKSWSLQKPLLSQVKHASKALNMAGSMSRLKSAIAKLVAGRFQRLLASVAVPAADDLRSNALKFFCPARRHPRRRATVLLAAQFFNGNWTQPNVIEHVCRGPNCCNDDNHGARQAEIILTKLFTALRPKIFSESNWIEWISSLQLFGFASAMHGILQEAWKIAFESEEAPMPGPDDGELSWLEHAWSADLRGGQAHNLVGRPGDEEDDQARMRQENDLSKRVALSWMRSGQVFPDTFLMRACLQPQQDLMTFLLHAASGPWESEQIGRILSQGHRNYRFTVLHDGALFQTFMRDTLQQFLSKRLWIHASFTEGWRTKLFQLTWRPAGIVFQLVMVRVANFPYALFGLLERGVDRELVATALLSKPKCLRDTFSKSFLQKYCTPQALCGAEAIAVLKVLAKKALASIFTTERLHSKNLRRAKGRSNTHYPDVKFLGLSHMASAHPIWCCPSKHDDGNSKPTGSQKKTHVIPKPKLRAAPGGGGPWRAFCSRHMSGRQMTAAALKSLGAAYKRLTPEEKQFYIDVGEAGLGAPTVQKEGSSTRGPSPCPSQCTLGPQGVEDEQ